MASSRSDARSEKIGVGGCSNLVLDLRIICIEPSRVVDYPGDRVQIPGDILGARARRLLAVFGACWRAIQLFSGRGFNPPGVPTHGSSSITTYHVGADGRPEWLGILKMPA